MGGRQGVNRPVSLIAQDEISLYTLVQRTYLFSILNVHFTAETQISQRKAKTGCRFLWFLFPV